MKRTSDVEIVLVSTGHQAMDHRVFDKEAVSLAKHFPRVRVVASHPGDEVVDGVQITALPPCHNRFIRFVWRPLQCLLAARGPGKRLLMLNDAELLFWAPLVKLFTGWKIIYDVHEDFPRLLLRRRWIPAWLRQTISAGIALAERCCATACDGIIGVTRVLTEAFHHRHRVAVYNLPSRAFLHDAARQMRPLEARDYHLVHLGTLSEERVEFLCAILTMLWQRRPGARVLIVGVRNDQVKELQARLPAEKATVIGKVDYQKVAVLLGNCRIGLDVHPILYPHLRCAVPVKVFEYMAAGCNVVASYLPELDGLLGQQGAEHVVTITQPSVERFCDEIVRLLASPESMLFHQRVLMTLVGTEWNWDHEEARLVEFVAQTIAGSEHRREAENSRGVSPADHIYPKGKITSE